MARSDLNGREKVLFSSYYWQDLRKEEEIFSIPHQSGSNVMIWGSFGWVGKSSMYFVDGRINSNGY